MKKRANALYERVLERWPWKSVEPSKPQWKIDGGQWSVERSATMMLRNVPAALLDRNEKENAENLSQLPPTVVIHPRGTIKGKVKARPIPVPRHSDYELCPYGSRAGIANKCKEWGKRCGVTVETRYYEE